MRRGIRRQTRQESPSALGRNTGKIIIATLATTGTVAARAAQSMRQRRKPQGRIRRVASSKPLWLAMLAGAVGTAAALSKDGEGQRRISGLARAGGVVSRRLTTMADQAAFPHSPVVAQSSGVDDQITPTPADLPAGRGSKSGSN